MLFATKNHQYTFNSLSVNIAHELINNRSFVLQTCFWCCGAAPVATSEAAAAELDAAAATFTCGFTEAVGMVVGECVAFETVLDVEALLGATTALDTGVELTAPFGVLALTLDTVEVFAAVLGVGLLFELAVEVTDVAAELEMENYLDERKK